MMEILRDNNNTIVALDGQVAMPSASAKIYWNRATQAVYVDAKSLPEPPQGMVYQVWSVKMNPFSPTSIGLLERAYRFLIKNVPC